MTFLANVEDILKKQGERGLEHLMFYHGLELELHRQLKNDAYSQVHGRNAGGSTEKVKDLIGVLQGDDFFQASDSYSGNFTSGYLYIERCDDKDILIGDTIKVVAVDNRQRRYRIDKKEQIGFTQEIFDKYKIINIGD